MANTAPPLLSKVSVEIKPHDGQPSDGHSIQVATDAIIQLTWETKNATGVRIDSLGQFGASGSTTIPSRDGKYTVIAIGAKGAQSAAWPLEVHTHEPDEFVSQHLTVWSGEHPALAHPADGTIDSTNCDQVLKRGDVLIKFAGVESSVTEKIIMAGEAVTKKLSGLFHHNIAQGNAGAFHAALYLGGGRTAEAHGGDLATARVGQRSIDDHGGFLFQVYRPKDQVLADAAAKVGETWANRRMKYKVPALVPFERASYGPLGHREALDYATHADTAGGPPDVDKMFCSQFVVACYQAAAGAALIEKKGHLKASELDMPCGIDLQASNTSPLALDAQMVVGVQHGVWEHVAEVLVRPQHAGSSAEVTPGPDLTGKLADIGIPTKDRWPSGNDVYARNPWSLRAFDGKLFVASGNANNPGPAPNQGPVDLWAWDKKEWKSEYVVQDEQVDVMPVLDGQLYIPGVDSHIGDGKKI
ncbi:MAG TPA: hypothetical protein VLW85_14400, partial [Myxococcales bacterium]|nr:hypothetical protein [Myxococcales bacterium]